MRLVVNYKLNEGRIDQLLRYTLSRQIFCLHRHITMDPEELEFLGEKLITSVIPNFTHDALHLICGSFGPFRAGIPVNVPLWLASHLRKQQKCRYVPPHWMDVDTLEAIKEAEKGSQSFTKMPSDHYMVETKLIIGETPEDVPRSEEIRTMIKDIFDIRMSKYRAFMDTYVRGESTQIKLDNLTAFEVHSCTPVFTHALDLIGRLKQKSDTAAYNSQTNRSRSHRLRGSTSQRFNFSANTSTMSSAAHNF